MADIDQTMEPQAPQPAAAPPVQQTAAPAAVDPENPERKRRVNNSTIFLKNPKVQASPIVRRINFLKSKGVKEDEIVEAFNNAGTTMTIESLKKAMESTPVVSAAPKAAPAAVPGAPGPQPHGLAAQLQPQPMYQQQPPQQQQQHTYYQQGQPQYPQQQQQNPYGMPPPPPPPHHVMGHHLHAPTSAPPRSTAEMVKSHWKDWVIGATALAGVSYIVGAAVSKYSPYTFVRKDEESSSSSSSQNVDVAAPPALPPLPEISEKEVELDKQLKEVQAESAFQKKKITELEDVVEKERKEKAELQIQKGKQAAQVHTLSRESEKAKRLQAEVIAARIEIEKLKEEASAASAAAAATTSSAASSSNITTAAAAESIELTTGSKAPTPATAPIPPVVDGLVQSVNVASGCPSTVVEEGAASVVDADQIIATTTDAEALAVQPQQEDVQEEATVETGVAAA